ncbi:MAG: DUF819 family protein, partial [Myxococcota bacterium]
MFLLSAAAQSPLITNDAVVLGILLAILGLVFWSSQLEHPATKAFYRYVPSLLLCYFVPGLLGTAGIIDGDQSRLYFVASRYLLPSSLVLLTLGLDLGAIRRLGPKIVVTFLAGTLGVMLGGPLVLAAFASIAPDLVGGSGPDAVWRGMSTVAGSWIGGGANQTAMKEIFGAGDTIFSAWIAVDVIVANVWMAFLLFGAARSRRFDRHLEADASALDAITEKAAAYEKEHARIPTTTDLFVILAVGSGATALAHVGADVLAPWFQE